MRRHLAVLTAAMMWARTQAAERKFDFAETPVGGGPAGFRAFVAGDGKPGAWRVVLDEVPNALPAVNNGVPAAQRVPVLAQESRDVTDERFPVLLWESERYGDITFSARIKVVEGAVEQIAGLVFRAQDEKNFYVARLNALEGNVRFYKFVNGQRSEPIGNNVPLARGEWHELSVRCFGNKIRIRLDDKDAMPELTDSTFLAGKVGFMTKSDTVAHFTGAQVDYRPLETLAAILVRQVIDQQPRLLGLRIYGTTTARPELHVLAARATQEVGLAAGATELKVKAENRSYFGREGETNIVTAPLHDRNGETAGVIQFFLKRFPGQTEANAIARVLPTIQSVEGQVGAARDLTEE